MPSHLRLIARAGSDDELSAILYSPYYVIRQKLGYVHNNPVEAGIVLLAGHCRLSSAANYADGKGILDVIVPGRLVERHRLCANGGNLRCFACARWPEAATSPVNEQSP